MSDIILASASPRRRELLDQIGIRYDVRVANVDETPLDSESPEELVVRLATLKANEVWQSSDQTRIVLGADTLGSIDDDLLVKPVDYEHAKEMLLKMSGRAHYILSAIAVVDDTGVRTALSKNTVWFRNVNEQEIEAYWQSGEPQDKAGAYAIQGFGAVFIEKISGSYSGIMGLPLFETAQLLSKLSVRGLKGIT